MAKRPRWRVVRHTTSGRPVEQKIYAESSAVSGIASWMQRRGVNRTVSRMDSRKYSYSFVVTFTYRFEGERRTYSGNLDVATKHPGTIEKQVEQATARRFRKNPGRMLKMRRGSFDIYQEAVTSLVVKQGAYLPGSEGWKHGSKKVKGGRVNKAGHYKRGYKVFRLGLVVERIRRRR